MISMMNNKFRFDRSSDTLEDSIGNNKVKEVGVDNANDKFPNPQVVDEVRNSSLELVSRAPESEIDTRSSGNVKSVAATMSSSGEFSVRVCSASGGRAENDMGLTGFAFKPKPSTIDWSDNPKIRFGAQNEQFQEDDQQEHLSGKQADVEKCTGFESKSLLSEFDDYVAAERSGGVRVGVSRDLGYGFEVGDMVWAKVKSHPWWPGHIFNEAFASPSVRRTKREGHLLVAFFGDSSYGWFEPDELVPFDPNFAEKSQQTNSRNFLKAVEEAVDEASRRRGLGLACRCRNPDNFRLTIQGYFSVDVPDYEPGGVYSNSQIRNARDSFRPNDTIDFVKLLALGPKGGEQKSISFIKNMATVFAYRRAVFEQYDETYAQAFGVPSLRLSHSQANPLNQPLRRPPMAPLSGPLVIAEALGGGKNSMKSMKVKKDRYLFKRRDEPCNSVQSAYKEEASDAAGRYVLQKRAPTVSVATQILDKQEDTGLISTGGAASTLDAFAKEAMMDQDKPNGSIIVSQGINPDAKPFLEKGEDAFQEMAESFEKDVILNKSMSVSDISWEKTVPIFGSETAQPSDMAGEASFDIKPAKNVKLSRAIEGLHQSEKALSTAAEASNDAHQVKDNYTVVYASPVEAKHHKTSVDGVAKKVKDHKRSAGDLNSESSAIGEKKKKKKKEFDSQMTTERLEKHSASGEVRPIPGKATGKGVSIGLAHREDFSTEQAQVDVNASNLLPRDGKGEVYPELPQLLGDLQALALDPFHGVEGKAPVIVRKFFLQLRSLVYQKSLVLSPPTDNDSLEVRTRPSTSVGASDNLPVVHARPSSVVKPAKRIVQRDDPTKSGRKRATSDRQEEIAAKRLKKIKDLKAMTAEKKVASQKISEARRGEGKEPAVPVPPKLAKPDLIRRVEPPAKVVERTILVIKFPPKTSLPSLAELKARFARFGPIDQSGLRVFWKTSTCRVVFLHKSDAQAAYNHAVGNNSLFGNVSVRCYLRDLEDSAAEVPEAAKARGDDSINETPRVKDPAVVRQTSVLAPQPQPLPHPVVQLKSCLKKSSGDESGQVTGNGGSSKGTPRVKFMLGGEENTRGDQFMVGNRNNFNNTTSIADGGAHSPVAMDFNSKNVQKVISQPPFPNVPLSQFAKTPQVNFHNSEMAMAPRNSANFLNTSASASTSATTVDISQQMISLLSRCNDVVTNLSGLLGYVPYHPL